MEQYLEHLSEDVLRWDILEKLGTLLKDDELQENERNVSSGESSLQRNYFTLFGRHPKMERRTYSTCNQCDRVFNPRNIQIHRSNCTKKSVDQTNQIPRTRVKNTKKKQIAPPLLDEPTPSTSTSSLSSSNSRLSEIPPISVSPPALTPISSSTVDTTASGSSSSTGNTSNSHKKLKKTSKEYDTDIHWGGVSKVKGPSKKSVSYSVHKLQLKSLASRRSNTSVSEKTSKNRHQRTKPSCTVTSENHDMDNKSLLKMNVVDDDKSIETITSSASSPISSLPTTSSFENVSNLNPIVSLDDIKSETDTSESGQKTVDVKTIVYKSPSPVPVVSLTDDAVKEEDGGGEAPVPTSFTSNGSIFLPIPDQLVKTQLYKPLPVALPSYNARKVDGAILLSNQNLEFQRKLILMAISNVRKKRSNSLPNCTTVSMLGVTPQRCVVPKLKNVNKINCKRSENDNKQQIKISHDVNGYIIHAGVNEMSDTSQHNHLIQENINPLNMN